ncbi:MAG: DNA polymerase III subunit beta [Firmicutes bacterium ADurb.Bin182]|nr:MAG: DNA polymerase III subunit beta [Firmicutes bacterium ADurb.Bin182]
MRFYLNNQDLNAGITTVIKALPPRSTNAAREGIYIEASKDGIRLKCSDLSLQIETVVPATVEEEGSVVLPGRIFSELVRKLQGEMTEINCENETAVIKNGRVQTTIQGTPADEFSSMSVLTGDIRFSLKQCVLKDMIKQSIFATASDESKPILTGVLFEIDNEELTMVALDGYRLALRKEEISKPLDPGSVVVPARSLAEISRTLLDSEESTDIEITKTHVVLDMGQTRIITRLLEGEFIKYKQILPTEHKTRVRLNRQELSDSIERASLMAREGKSNLVKMSFSMDTLTITANNELGKINEEISIELIGSELDIAFNGRYFIDVLKALDDEEIYLDMNSNISPCVVRPVQGDKFYYLILPVRLFVN